MKTLIATIAALTISGVAHAQTPAQTTRIAVAYVDLDLDSAEGRRTLQHRVDRAVRQVCPDRPQPREMLKSELWRSCIAGARKDADVQIAALYSGQKTLALNVINVTGQIQGTAR